MRCKGCGSDASGLYCADCRLQPKRSSAEVKVPLTVKMTKPEKVMAQMLESEKRTGFVREWWFECIKLKLGVERTHYTPDFFVEYADGTFGFIEVKGPYMRDDSRVKFQAAAREHTWATWRMEKLTKGGVWVTVAHYGSEAA